MAKLTGNDPETEKGRLTRERILEAALQEFSAAGFAGARIEHIARNAGINKQRIYAYFGDKEGLFTEVWKQTSDYIAGEDRKLLELGEEHIPDLGRILLGRFLTFHDDHPEFWRIFVLENYMGWRHVRRFPSGNYYTHIRSLYERGQDAGVFDPEVSFESFLFVLIAVTFFYASNRKTMSDTLGIDLTEPTVRDRVFREIDLLLSRSPERDDRDA